MPDNCKNTIHNVSGDDYYMQCAITEHFNGRADVDYWVGSGVPQLDTITKGSLDVVQWPPVVSEEFAAAIIVEIEKYLPKK